MLLQCECKKLAHKYLSTESRTEYNLIPLSWNEEFVTLLSALVPLLPSSIYLDSVHVRVFHSHPASNKSLYPKSSTLYRQAYLPPSPRATCSTNLRRRWYKLGGLLHSRSILVVHQVLAVHRWGWIRFAKKTCRPIHMAVGTPCIILRLVIAQEKQPTWPLPFKKKKESNQGRKRYNTYSG